MKHEVKKVRVGYVATLDENESFVIDGEYPSGLYVHGGRKGVYLTYAGLEDGRSEYLFKLPANAAALRALATAIRHFADDSDRLSQLP